MGNEKIWENAKQNILGMKVRTHLNFVDNVFSLC